MELSFNTTLRLYDEDKGILHRNCRVSVHVSGDPISVEYFKNTVSTTGCAISAILEDTDLERGQDYEK